MDEEQILIIIIILLLIFLFNDPIQIFLRRTIEKFTTKTLTTNKPYLKLLEGFLSPQECQHIIDLCKPRFKRSNVIKMDGKSRPDPVRTSSSCVIKESEDPIVRAVEAKASKATGVPIKNIEGLQIVRYHPGQEYQAHNDWFHHSKKIDNQRYFTIFAYLNDNFTGGETEFVNINYKTKPKRGDAVMWRNCDQNKNETCYQEAKHRGVPPTTGVKYGLNIWIRFEPYRKS